MNHWDLVPGVPWPTPWGYEHTGDPRLLAGPHPTEALRRDHGFLARLYVDLRVLFEWPFTSRFSAADDHMIWNYRTQLEVISAARARPGETR